MLEYFSERFLTLFINVYIFLEVSHSLGCWFLRLNSVYFLCKLAVLRAIIGCSLWL